MHIACMHACMYGRLCAWLVKHRYVFFFCFLSFSIIILSATALLATIGGIELVFFLWGEVVWS